MSNIVYIEGDIFNSNCECLVNPVNTMGISGRGLALQFKNKFPDNFESYKNKCVSGFSVGYIHATYGNNNNGRNIIIVNFPTKNNWKLDSKLEYIESGLRNLSFFVCENGIKSIAVPALGCGEGKLEWVDVKLLLDKYLDKLDIYVEIYKPVLYKSKRI